MKNVLFCLLFMVLILVACKGQNEEQKANESNQENTTTTNLEKQNACELLDIEKIATLMGLPSSDLKNEDMGTSEKRSICYYFNEAGNRKFFIRLAWKSEKAIANNVLENKYKQYLERGENDIKTYEMVSKENDQQILYGIGQDREGKFIHIMRKRIGNSAEIQLEFTKEVKEDALKTKLLKIIEGI